MLVRVHQCDAVLPACGDGTHRFGVFSNLVTVFDNSVKNPSRLQVVRVWPSEWNLAATYVGGVEQDDPQCPPALPVYRVLHGRNRYAPKHGSDGIFNLPGRPTGIIRIRKKLN